MGWRIGGEFGPDRGGDRRVVEADDRQVAGHVEAAPVRHRNGRGRHVVVAGEDRRGHALARQQLFRGLEPGLVGEESLDDERRDRPRCPASSIAASNPARRCALAVCVGWPLMKAMRVWPCAIRCAVISRAAWKSSMRTQDTSSRALPVARATAGTPSAANAAAMAFDSHSGGGRITPAMPSESFCAAAFSCAGLRLSQRSSTSCAAVRCEPSSAPTSISREIGRAGVRIDERDARVARAGEHARRGIRPVVERAHRFHHESRASCRARCSRH